MMTLERIETPWTALADSPAAVLEARGLVKEYTRGSERIRALDGVDLNVYPREFLVIAGPSGAGKTTLLQMLGCMDVPTSGSVRVQGRSTAQMSDRELTRVRRETIGFVFQHFGLVPTLTVLENVALPGLFGGRGNRQARALELIDRVGLSARRNHRPHELSGGEMQRAAIARALVQDPAMVLADEPTGNLDSRTSAEILALLGELNADGVTLVVVTHNESLSAAATRRVELRDGRVLSSTEPPKGNQ